MTTPSARIAAQISEVTRRLQAVERGPQLDHSSVNIDGADVLVTDGLAAGLRAEVAAADAIAAASSAEAKADGAVVTFYGSDADLSTAKQGDFWVEDNGHSQIYSGAEWLPVTSQDVEEALAAARSAEAAVDGKITTFFGPTAPTAQAVGDLWFDTDNGNLLTRWDGTFWVPARDAGVAQALADAATAQQAADDAAAAATQAANDAAAVQALADDARSRADAAVTAAHDAAAQAEAAEATANEVSGTAQAAQDAADAANTAAQTALEAAQSAAQQSDVDAVTAAAAAAQSAADAAQAAANDAGTDAAAADARAAQAAADAARAISDAANAANAANAAQGTANTAKTNAASAQSTADAARTAATNAQSTADAAQTAATNARNAATAAQSAADAANTQALSAAGIANGKGKVYYQTSAPAGDPNGLWIDTTGGANTPKRWNGTTWVAVTDKTATDAATAAAAAQTAAQTAQSRADAAATAAAAAQTSANNAQTTANSALTTANGKGKVWFQSTAPTASSTFDLWFDTANDNRLWKWDGTNWVNFGLGDAALSSITAGKIVTGTLQAATRIIAGTDGGARVEVQSGGVLAYSSATTQTVNIGSNGSAWITGELRGSSVVTGQLTAQGDGTQRIVLSSGASNCIFFYSGSSTEDYPGIFWSDVDSMGPYLQIRPSRQGAANEALVSRIRMYAGNPGFGYAKQIYIDAATTVFEGDTANNGKVVVGNDTEFGSTAPRSAPLLIGNATGTLTTSRRMTIDRRKIQAWADIYPDNLYLNHYGAPVIVNGRMIIGAEGTNVSGTENVNLFYASSGSFRIGLSSTGIAYIQTQTGAAYRPIYASAFTVQSEGRLKRDIDKIPFSGLDALRNAPSRKWKRQSEPDYETEEVGIDPETGEHFEKFSTKKRREQDVTQFGPLLEELPQDLHRVMDSGHPDLAGAMGYDLVSLVGVLWEAVRELDAELDTLRAANKVAKPKRKAT